MTETVDRDDLFRQAREGDDTARKLLMDSLTPDVAAARRDPVTGRWWAFVPPALWREEIAQSRLLKKAEGTGYGPVSSTLLAATWLTLCYLTSPPNCDDARRVQQNYDSHGCWRRTLANELDRAVDHLSGRERTNRQREYPLDVEEEDAPTPGYNARMDRTPMRGVDHDYVSLGEALFRIECMADFSVEETTFLYECAKVTTWDMDLTPTQVQEEAARRLGFGRRRRQTLAKGICAALDRRRI